MYFARAMGSELFRLPVVFDPATMAVASLIALGAVALSSLIVRQRIDNLNMVEALKNA